VTIGLGFVTPYDVVVRGRILYPEKPQFLLADRVQSVAVQAAIGLDIGYGIRLGGGFAALAALDGSVVVATDASGRIGTTVEDTLVASFAPIVGAAYDIDERWRVGLAFRGVLRGRFNVVISAEDLGALNIPPLNISGVAQYDPWQLAPEVAYQAGPWALALGITYKHWPAYPGPVEATVRCQDSGDPELMCLALAPPDPGYAPVASPRAGIEHRFALPSDTELAVRGGYGFEPSPAPEQKGRQSYFDNHRSIFSAGFGIELDKELLPLAFDGFFQLQWLHARSHEKSVADGASIDGTVETSGFLIGGGTAARVEF
jgi:long-chain fatty acid transport protein